MTQAFVSDSAVLSSPNNDSLRYDGVSSIVIINNNVLPVWTSLLLSSRQQHNLHCIDSRIVALALDCGWLSTVRIFVLKSEVNYDHYETVLDN